jgi:hypothetical protein
MSAASVAASVAVELAAVAAAPQAARAENNAIAVSSRKQMLRSPGKHGTL